MIRLNRAVLLLIDLQNDFCPGGALAVPQGDESIPVANKLMPYFNLVIASKDWHPADHSSFKSVSDAGLWPPHCIQQTPGASFHPDLKTHQITKIFCKGMDKTIDSYSAFYDNAHLQATGLGDYLKSQGIESIYLMGLATEYCVKYSCLDALKLNFKIYLITDGCRGIDSKDAENAFIEMRNAGVVLTDSKTIITGAANAMVEKIA
jgi:nicotinamidase/pyrazinamidase